MQLQAGMRLGPYEIERPVGAGGMGEVYRARDTRLHRSVAIKVLPAELRDDPERKRQFEREAQAVATLNHPHICVLHDIGHDQGIDFLVLEYLDGETLAARLEQGPIPLDEVLRHAVAIAGALERAHGEGIVHRDLKPANIMLTRSGPKLMDFGLARLRRSGESATTVPTETASFGVGRIVGTLPYMAPEQLQGKTADARTDIFAFGTVLYEMVAGKRAFDRGTDADTIAAVLATPPRSMSSPLEIPAAFDHVIERCLARNPDERWQTAHDLKVELEWLVKAEPSRASSRLVPTRRQKQLAAVAAVVLAVGAAAWSLWPRLRSPSESIAEVRHTQVTSLGDVVHAAISPDGRTIAFVIDEPDHQRLMVKDLSVGSALELFRADSVANLGWSPDGALVTFYRRGIYGVPRFGGQPRFVAGGAYYAWSPDGSRIAAADGAEGAIRIGQVGSGQMHRVAIEDVGLLHDIDWSRQSDRLAILSRDKQRLSVIWIVTPDGKGIRRIYSDAMTLQSPRWSPTGDAVYCLRTRDEGTDLLKVPVVDSDSVAPQVLLSGLPPIELGFRPGALSLSADGRRLLHVRALTYSNLWLADLTGSGPIRPITRGTSTFQTTSLSPDGTWIVASVGSGSRVQVVKLPVAGGDPIPLTAGDQQDMSPAWSPDGMRIAFVSNRSGKPQVHLMNTEGRLEHSPLDRHHVGANMSVTWTPDGRVAWQQTAANNFMNYRIRDLATGSEELLADERSGGWIFVPRFSPRGDQLVVYWNRRRQEEPDGLWVLTWPQRRERFLLQSAFPLGWSADGAWVYTYGSRADAILAVSTRTGETKTVATIQQGTIVGGDVTPNGGHAVINVGERKGDVWLIENFDPQISRRAR